MGLGFVVPSVQEPECKPLTFLKEKRERERERGRRKKEEEGRKEGRLMAAGSLHMCFLVRVLSVGSPQCQCVLHTSVPPQGYLSWHGAVRVCHVLLCLKGTRRHKDLSHLSCPHTPITSAEPLSLCGTVSAGCRTFFGVLHGEKMISSHSVPAHGICPASASELWPWEDFRRPRGPAALAHPAVQVRRCSNRSLPWRGIQVVS